MWQSVIWWRAIDNRDVARSVADLQQATLRLVVGSAALGYVAWHIAQSAAASRLDAARPGSLNHWLLAPLAVACLTGAWRLLGRHPRAAAWFFLLAATLTVAGAVWLLDSPSPMVLLPLLALAAVVVLHPLAGGAVSGAGLAALAVLQQAGPLAWLPSERLAETAAACLLTLGVAWLLARNLVVTVEWSSRGYAEAWRNAQEARANRAELMQALKQLDHAYYAVQRANAALELAWKAADAAERSKSEFVTNISHELRTPLNLITGFSEMILTSPETYRTPLPAAYRGDLNAIYRGAQHLLALTNDVIDLARVGIGRLSLVREPAELAQIIADAAAMIHAYVGAKGLWLRIEVAPGLPVLHLDAVRIRQVLLNLLTNAARFTERGGITVAADLEADGVVVRVRDTGVGIAPADLAKVFDEFYSGGERRDSAGRALGGIGLGLPLSRRLVELHGGRIGVESQLGAGATFWFRLPTAAMAEPPIATDRSTSRRDPTDSAPERILVVAGADEPVVETLQRHLPGYRLVPAADGARAAAAATALRAVGILAGPGVELGAGAPAPVFQVPLPGGGLIAAGLGAHACLSKPLRRARLQAALEGLDRPPRTILLVDDDQHFLRLLTRMLQAITRGVAVIRIAHNGREALAMLAAWRPDLVILDLAMPALGGSDTLAAMRADPCLAALPVIVVSGHDLLQAQTPLHGPIVVAKPEGFVLQELLGAIEGLLAALRPPRPYAAGATGDSAPVTSAPSGHPGVAGG